MLKLMPGPVWGGTRARPRLTNAVTLLGSDRETVYVLGERNGAVLLDAWSASTGVRTSSAVVSSAGRLQSERVWRGSHDDEVIFGLRGFEVTERVTVDLRTASVRDARRIDRDGVLCATSKRGDVFAWSLDGVEVWLRSAGDDVRVPGPVVTCVGLSDDGAWLAAWDPGVLAVYALPFADDREPRVSKSLDGEIVSLVVDGAHGRVWAVGLGEVRCLALDSLDELGRWEGASRGDCIAGLARDGSAALLDGHVAFAVGVSDAVSVDHARWRSHLARLSTDGARLAHGSGVLGWHDLTRDERVDLHTSGHAGGIEALAVSADGAFVASASADRTVRVTASDRDETVWVLERDAERIAALAFAPDGRRLYGVTHGLHPRVVIWSLDDGAEITPHRCLVPHATHLTVSPDGARLALSHRTASMPCSLVDVERLAPLALVFDGAHREYDGACAFTAAGDALRAVCFDPNTLAAMYLFDAREGDRRNALDARTSVPGALGSLSSTATWGVCARRDRVAFFSATTLAPLRSFSWWNLPVRAVLAGEEIAAIAASIDEVGVCARDAGEGVATVDRLGANVSAMAFAPGDAFLVVGLANGQVLRYDVGQR